MRLTNNMMTNNIMRNIRQNTAKLDRFNNELSTGKKISKPSDDPVGTLRSMQLNTVIGENDQYIANIQQALDWLESTDLSLDKVTTTLHRARELAIYGSSDTLEQKQRETLRDEVIQLRDHLVNLANTSLNGRYVFSGFKTTTKPYTAHNSPYQGDTEKLSVEVGKDVKVDYSIPGNAVFDNAFQVLNDIIGDLNAGDTATLSSTRIADVDQVMDDLMTTRSELGSKVRRLEMAESRYDDVNVKFTQHLSHLEDVDISETIMNLRMQENVYRASLASGARIIQPSLLDFLK